MLKPAKRADWEIAMVLRKERLLDLNIKSSLFIFTLLFYNEGQWACAGKTYSI